MTVTSPLYGYKSDWTVLLPVNSKCKQKGQKPPKCTNTKKFAFCHSIAIKGLVNNDKMG